jgi:hypothetical protein
VQLIRPLIATMCGNRLRLGGHAARASWRKSSMAARMAGAAA